MKRTIIMVILLLGGGATADAASLPAQTPLTAAFAEALVRDALEADGDEVRVVIEQPSLPLGNQATSSTEVVLAGLSYDRDGKRFRGDLVGTVDGAVRFRLPIHGRIQALVRVPTLRHALASGELVTADDLTWLSIAPHRLPAGSLRSPDDIIGSETRRRLAPGRALNQRDLQAPRLVHRGRPVELVYTRPGLRVAVLGFAQDDGALGEMVRVTNASSRRALHGVVTGPDEVTLGTTGAPAP